MDGQGRYESYDGWTDKDGTMDGQQGASRRRGVVDLFFPTLGAPLSGLRLSRVELKHLNVFSFLFSFIRRLFHVIYQFLKNGLNEYSRRSRLLICQGKGDGGPQVHSCVPSKEKSE
jgi:hypothetical protein